MACGSGCCGATPDPQFNPLLQSPRNDADSCGGVEDERTESPIDNCPDTCCAGPNRNTESDGIHPSSGAIHVTSCSAATASHGCNGKCVDDAMACCSPSQPPVSRASKVSCSATDSCCTPRRANTCDSTSKPPCAKSCCPPPRKPSFDSKSQTPVPSCTSMDSCCDFKPIKVCDSTITTCADVCCDDVKFPTTDDPCCTTRRTGVTETAEKAGHVAVHDTDPELGLSGKEHVVLSVSGMTCTGCETKLLRTLGTLPSVTKLKTSLILSRAEFDLETGTQTVAEVMRHLERTTEFKCERVTNRGSSLDLLCAGDVMDIIKGTWPSGVLEVSVLDKRLVRIDFDAKVIGARELLGKDWPHPMELAPPSADPTLDTGARHVRNVGYITLLSIVLTIPVLVLSWAPLPHKEQNEITFGSISLAFATLIQIIVAGPFYPKALKALIFSRVIEMDLLIVLSTSAAYIFSVVAFGYLAKHQPLSTGEFFETSTLLVTLIMVGRFIAALARQKAVESISIRSLQASCATIIHPNGTEEQIDTRLLQYGDIFKVSPDSRIPTDGTVLSGASEIDESMLTGESRPVEKSTGSRIIAGSLNGSGVLTVKLTRIPGDNTISTIAGMVDEAKLTKPKIQEIADQVATYFVPVVVSITIVVFCIWVAVGIAVQQKSASEATIQAITYAITVLIVSCPCAIGLAVPMVIVVATGVAAEKGVVFKSADALEVAWKTTHVVFDKTGTLTEGRLSVAQREMLNPSVGTQALLLGLIRDSKHPVSIAVATHLKSKGVAATAISKPKNVVGKGVEGAFAGRMLRAGNSRWLGFTDHPSVQPTLAQGYTAFCFAIDGELAAVFGLQDSLREDTLNTVIKLQERNIALHVLSGDDDGAVLTVTDQLGIPAANVRSRCTPADKQAYIKELLSAPGIRKSGRNPKQPIVMFCGDGTNDAVALAQASIGVHMNGGTDVAKSAADIVLMRPSLAGILVAMAVSRKSMHRIAFNFGWSFVYNVFAILLAAGAFVHARIPPEFAGLGELVSVLPVVAAGMLLKSARIQLD